MPDLSFIYRTVNEHGYRTFHFGKEMVAYWNWCPACDYAMARACLDEESRTHFYRIGYQGS